MGVLESDDLEFCGVLKESHIKKILEATSLTDKLARSPGNDSLSCILIYFGLSKAYTIFKTFPSVEGVS